MDSRYKKNDKCQSYYLERQEQVSIEGRGSVFIKNTQTQVRELYRRHVAPQAEEQSSSSSCSKFLNTSQQMSALNEKIENEIGKLKNFRNCLLQNKNRNNLEKPLLPVASRKDSKNERIDSSTPINQQGRGNQKELMKYDKKKTTLIDKDKGKCEFSSPDSNSCSPYFQNMCSLISPVPRAVKDNESQSVSAADSLLTGQSQTSTREKGGCTYPCDDDIPCSVYQADYSPYNTNICPCDACHPVDFQCQEYPTTPPFPCSPRSCYQYPMVANYNRQKSPHPSICTCSTCVRRVTDLNTDECIRNSPPRATTSGRSKIPKHQFRSPSPTKKNKEAKSREQYSNKDQVIGHSAKVSQMRNQPNKSGNSKTAKKRDQIKITTKMESSQSDEDKLRLHREYLAHYKQEHEKTVKKETSSSSSLHEPHPTYTKLTSAKKEKQSIALKGAGIKYEPSTIDKKKVLESRPTYTKLTKVKEEKETKSKPPTLDGNRKKQEKYSRKDSLYPKDQQIKELETAARNELRGTQAVGPSFHDVGINFNLSSKSFGQQYEESKECCGCAKQESASPVKDIGLNCCLSCRCDKKECVSCETQISGPIVKDIGLNCSLGNRSCFNRSICDQSCQTTLCPAFQLENQASGRQTPTNAECKQIGAMTQGASSEENMEAYPSYGPTVQRKYQSEPSLRSPTNVVEQENALNTVYEPQGYRDIFIDKNMSHYNQFNSEKEGLCRYQENVQVSMRSESPSSNEYARDNRTYPGQVHNTSYYTEEEATHFTLPLDSSHSSMATDQTFYRTQQNSPQFRQQLHSQKNKEQIRGQLYNSPTLTTNNNQSFNQQKLYQYIEPRQKEIELVSRAQLTPTSSRVCEKRVRSVKFEDESGFSEQTESLKLCRSVIDWERAHRRTQEETEYTSPLNDLCEELDQVDSYRSSSTADMTCIESVDEADEDYLTCTESRTEHTLPRFNGCCCMRDRYEMLAALTKPIGQLHN